MRPEDQQDGGVDDGLSEADWPETGLSRRTLLRTASAASLALPVAAGAALGADAEAAGPGVTSPRGRFFSAADLAVVDELAEMVIPADDHAPGARAAGVAREIDRRLAEIPPYDGEGQARRRLWREGLRWLDVTARGQHEAAFLAATPAQRLALLTAAARNEARPTAVEERFFVELKREVAGAYYTSEIGLKQELEYKGNSYLEEFAGEDVATVPLRRKLGP